MASDQVKRKLVAILAADIAGYSRLMGADEAGTLARLKEYRRELIDLKNKQYRGRVMKTTGDGILIEFPSVVDAISCSLEVQQGIRERNADIPPEKRIEFRIGINLGDVIVEGRDLYGDGVNIAARLEGLAEPGGICISQTVLNHARGKVAFDVEDLGEQTLKNIVQSIHIYRLTVNSDRGSAVSRPLELALALPDKPSIAVLPFQNMGLDPEQDYFADGVVEDIITALSRFSELFVIARNSSFTYKGRAVDVKQVGRELGVRYVLEGSVRKAGNRVRITGQLIDAIIGAHLWADHFDGSLDNIFDLQDEIAVSVVGAIAPKLQQAEIERAKRKPTGSLDAYDYYLRGVASLYRWTRDASDEALRLFYRAIDLDPEFGSAYGMAARCQIWRSANRWISEENEKLEAVRLARLAVVFGSEDAAALAAAGLALAYLANDLDAGATFIDRALAMNPNMATAWHFSCWIRIMLGLPDLALSHERRAMRLSPLDPLLGHMQTAAALAELCAGRFVEASLCAQKARNLANYPIGLGVAAASSALAGRLEEAQNAVARLRQLIPAPVSQISLPYRSGGPRTARCSRKACAKPDCWNHLVPPKSRRIETLPSLANIGRDSA
jgi:TolB-like protein/class 3 adenylate cyclase